MTLTERKQRRKKHRIARDYLKNKYGRKNGKRVYRKLRKQIKLDKKNKKKVKK